MSEKDIITALSSAAHMDAYLEARSGDEVIADINAALSAQQREPGVRVKDLKWSPTQVPYCWTAGSAVGNYWVVLNSDGTYSFSSPHGNNPHEYASPDAAKSAAQADHEQRIMAAIEIQSSDGLCPVPPGKNKPVSTETASDEGESSDSAAVRRMSGSESTGSLAPAIATTQCEDRASPGPSEAIAEAKQQYREAVDRVNNATDRDIASTSDPVSGRSQPSPDVSVDELATALDRLVNAKALNGVREQVAGWNGEGRDEPYKERHPSRLGATLPKTNCGAVYELDDAMQSARALLSRYSVRRR